MADDVNALGTIPIGETPNNIPAHIQALKDSINAGSINRRLTQAQINALSAAEKPVGVVVNNMTTLRLEVWTGAKWDDVSARAQYAAGWSTADQSVIAQTSATVTYGAESDPGSLLTSGMFLAPVAGAYLLTAHVRMIRNGAQGLFARARLVVGGADAAVDLVMEEGAMQSEWSANLTTLIPMNAGNGASIVVDNLHIFEPLAVRGRLGAALINRT